MTNLDKILKEEQPMTILRTLISEMIETYLEEETGLQTAKNLSKHFGSTPNRITGKPIQSQKWKNNDYSPAPTNEKHHVTLSASRGEVKDHLIKSGWKQHSTSTFHHPDHGAKHTVKLDDGPGNTTKAEIFKTDHKGSMAEY
jgi:hypothetical protein